jgi:hypothetical protein
MKKFQKLSFGTPLKNFVQLELQKGLASLPPLYIGIHSQKYSVAIPSFKKLKEYKIIMT